MGSAISSSLSLKLRREEFSKNTTKSLKEYGPVLIDRIERAFYIQGARKEGRTAFLFPLAAEGEQMGADLVDTLYVGRRVALYALVLVP
jgi:hypothetical protein